MSDRDLRRILDEIIEDFDTGRIQLIRSRMPGIRNVVGSAVIAVTLGLGGVACDTQSVGTTTDAGPQRDAAAQIDGGADLLYMAPPVDAGPMPEYAEPFVDGGIMPAYAEPFPDDGGGYEYLDAGDVPAYMAPSWDAGTDPDPEVDGGNNAAYAVPPIPPED